MENRFSLSPSKVFGKLRGLIDEYDSCVESEGDWPEDEEGILRYLGELEREQQLLCQLSRKLGNMVAQRRRLINFKMGLLLCDLEDLGIPPEQVERISQ